MKYTIPGFSVFLSATAWLGEQWLSAKFGNAFANAPFGWILLIALALLAGVVYADALNESSSLRTAIRDWAKVIEVEEFVLAHKTECEISCYEATIKCRFVRRLSDILCSIQVTQYAGLKHAEKTFVISQDRLSHAEENLRKSYVVARFPRRVAGKVPESPYWVGEPKHTWAGDGNHVVTLRISSGLFRRQTEAFLVASIRNVGEGPEPVLLFGGQGESGFIQIGKKA